MIGKIYPSEMRQYTDPKSGRPVIQLTQKGLNDHMYFTDNSFDIDGGEIYFVSNRPSYRTDLFNIFKMDLSTGEMVQLTDEPEGVQFNAFTKTPDSELIAYKTGNSIKVLNTKTGKNSVVYTESGRMRFGQMHISPDKTTIGFARNESVGPERDGRLMDTAANYEGFFDKLFAIKDGRISTVNIDGSDFKDVYYDTHWLGHFQFSPDDGLGMSSERCEQVNKEISTPSSQTTDASIYGLRNVHQRLRLTFGEQYGLTVISRYMQGTTVVVLIPFTDNQGS